MTVFVDITMSVDGYVAGPNQTLEHPLGEGGTVELRRKDVTASPAVTHLRFNVVN
jgi:hypothetical protein